MYYEVDDFTDPWITDKETVWLQHGVGRSTRFWYHWVPPLARHYQVIRRDMRGHGQSADPGPDHHWSLDELVTDMHAFMDALGLRQVHYVGESIGGILGVLFATRWPERLKSLTICNSPTTIRPAGTRALSGEQGNLHKLLASEGSIGWGRLMIERKIISGNSPEHIEWVLKEWAKTPAHVLQGITKTLDGADTAPRADPRQRRCGPAARRAGPAGRALAAPDPSLQRSGPVRCSERCALATVRRA